MKEDKDLYFMIRMKENRSVVHDSAEENINRFIDEIFIIH